MSYDKGRPKKTVSHPHALSIIDQKQNQVHIFRVNQYGDLECQRGPDGKLKPDLVKPLPIVVDAKVSEIDVTCKTAQATAESDHSELLDDAFEDCGSSDGIQTDEQAFDENQDFFKW